MSLNPEEQFDTITGLPLIEKEEKASNIKKAAIRVSVILSIYLALGIGIAFLIMKYGSTDTYNARIEIAIEYDLKWAYLGTIIFAATVIFLNFYPVFSKEKVMRTTGGNMRANQFIYRLANENPKESSAVVLCEHGDLGFYNRGNRGIYHFLESCLPMLVTLPLGFFTFPFPTFVLTVIYSIGRILYQIGYTKKGFGGHFFGLMLDRAAGNIMMGLLILSAIKQF